MSKCTRETTERRKKLAIEAVKELAREDPGRSMVSIYKEVAPKFYISEYTLRNYCLESVTGE